VAIVYLEMIVADAASEIVQVLLLRTNHGVVEAAGEDCQDLIGNDRAKLEAFIVEGEEAGLEISFRSLVGVNYIRTCFPHLNAQLVLEEEKISE
jgi:hypothetical protein